MEILKKCTKKFYKNISEIKNFKNVVKKNVGNFEYLYF